MSFLLCLDVGFSNMGWSLFNRKGELYQCGVFTTEKSAKKRIRVSDDNANRAVQMAHLLANLANKYAIIGACAELPHGGSQNARAMSHMSIATTIVAVSFLFLDIPIEYYTSAEVKKAVTGKKNASKQEMMNTIAKMFSIKKETRTFTIRKGKRRGETTELQKYEFAGKSFSGSAFEHIADSIGVYVVAKHGNLIRML